MFVDLITVLVLLSLLIATIWRPPVAYAAVVVTFALEQWAQAAGSYFAQHSATLNYLVGIIVLAGLIASLAKGKRVLGSIESVYVCMVLFLGFALLSTTWMVERQMALSIFWYAAPYLATYALAVPLIFCEKDDFRVALVATAIVGCFAVPALAFGTSLHAWGRTIESATAVVDRYGRENTRLNPLAVASYAGTVVLTFLLGHVGKTSRLLGLAGWVIVPIGMFLIVRSGSRGQFFGAVLAGALMVKFSYPGLRLGRLFGWVLGLAVLAATAYFTVTLFSTESTRFDVTHGYNEYMGTRGIMVTRIMEEWLRSSPMNIMFGLGMASSWMILGTYPHVQVVEVLCELGLFGFAFATGILLTTMWKFGLGLQLTKRDLAQRGAMVAFGGFTLLYAILSFKQGSFLTNYSFYMNLAIVAKMSTICARAQSRADLERRHQWLHWQHAQALANPAMQ